MKSKELIILISIVLVDLITKIAANYYLPFQEYVYIFDNKVGFYLTYNQRATGGQADFILSNEYNKNLTIILSCINALILLSYILFIRKRPLRILYKVLIAIALMLILSVASELVRPLLIDLNISSWTTSVVGKITGLTIYGSVFLSKNKWIKFSVLVIMAAGVGNLISHFYIPFRIIDFMYIEGTYKLLRIGVFNVADIAFNIGAIGLVISIIVLLIKRVRLLIMNNQDSIRQIASKHKK